jgi:non-specific serine/threonine protein kinase
MGKLIANRFTINNPEKDLLGRGGMGDVYRATDTQTGETVAVKALNPEILARDPTLLERFVREGEALRQLNHPNIVRMVAAVEEDGRHYLVMEYVGGGSLQDLLSANEPLPHERIIQIALDLSDALTRAHRLCIVHRDLKPANVLLADDGTPRLADFGIAHLTSDSPLTQSGIVIGSIDYLSPEACKGETLDERADIWSFGVMLFQMLSGKKPFEGNSMVAKLNAILTQKVPDLSQLAPHAPDALIDLVYRMLQKDPQQRIPSVRLVGAELESMLKGWQVVTPSHPVFTESRFETPTPSTQKAKHNLPTQPTSFVGRQAELTELARLLTDPAVRLLTILGAGGMGKTRLALEAGTAQLNNFNHGVFFVSLAPLESIEAIIPATAQAIGFSFYESGDPRQQLLDYLGEKHMLLIMDNFEHLLEGAIIVTEILQAAPQVRILCTSHVRLDLLGEQLFHLEGMEFPEWEIPTDAMDYSAVKLFLQSAHRIRPDFELVADNLKYVARICRLAGGMPMGILLAAAWVEMLTPQEIAEEMQRSLDFLATEHKSVPERQRSMQAVFDYSCNLLTEREREVFRGLSVFRGGFTREAAQQIIGASLRDLMGLVDKSLLQRAPSGRYNLHELVRQYGEQKLLEAGKENALRQRHLEYYLSLAEQSLGQPIGSTQRDWLPRMATENDNLRAALGWCLDSGNFQTGLRLAICLGYFWLQSGCMREGQDWLERLLARAPQPTLERAGGLQYLGLFVYNMGDYSSALPLFEEGLALFEALGDLSSVADTTLRLAWPHLALGNYAQSRHLLERSLNLYQDLNKPEHEAYVIEWLGDLARAEGDFVRARELLEQSAALQRYLEDKIRLSYVLSDLGFVLIHFGELDRSEALFKETMSIQLKLGTDTTSTSLLFMGFAFLANARGQPLRAVRLLGAWEALCKSTGYHIEGPERPDYESNLASLRAQLDESTFEAAWAEGAALTLEQAVEFALSDEASR